MEQVCAPPAKRRGGMPLDGPKIPVPTDLVIYNEEVPNETALSRLPAEARTVLDVGCGAGANGRWLRDRGFRAIGLTNSFEEAVLARRHYRAVAVGDAERFFPCGGAERLDAVLFLDALEHFRDPWKLLENCRANLSEKGCVVAFIPNVAHLSARVQHARGSFRYTATGLMDRTHLRFFDRNTVRELFEATGYRIQTFENIWTRTPSRFFPGLASRMRRLMLRSWPSAFARHFLIVARPLSKASRPPDTAAHL